MATMRTTARAAPPRDGSNTGGTSTGGTCRPGRSPGRQHGQRQCRFRQRRKRRQRRQPGSGNGNGSGSGGGSGTNGGDGSSSATTLPPTDTVAPVIPEAPSAEVLAASEAGPQPSPLVATLIGLCGQRFPAAAPSRWSGGSPGRSQSLEAIAGSHFEVVVIGGGITGAGVALDAASRGYSVALLEGRDYAIGTSSRPRKWFTAASGTSRTLTWGWSVKRCSSASSWSSWLRIWSIRPRFGCRASGRRSRIARSGWASGPTTCWPGDQRAQTAASGAGAGDRPRRRIPVTGPAPDDRPGRAARTGPGPETRDPESAYLFWRDCQTDDARLVLTVLGEAERFGAVCLNGANVTRVLEKSGKARQVEFTEIIGETVVVEADNIVNATGVWADQIRLAKSNGKRTSRRSHRAGRHPLFSADDVTWAGPPVSCRPARAAGSSPCPGTAGP